MSRSNKLRRLIVESLENRSLMAADCHNLLAPLDVNDDSIVTPSDAVMVINNLNSADRTVQDPSTEGYVDVNDDGNFSPSDALKVINHLNSSDKSTTVPDSGWTKVDGQGRERMGVKVTNNSDGSVDLEVRIQNAEANGEHPVFLQDKLIGTVETDARGRGFLKLDANSDLANRLPEILLDGQQAATLVVDSVATVDLKGEGERNSPRAQENRLISKSNVFTTPLTNAAGERIGEVVYGTLGDRSFLGVYARGLTAGQAYDVVIDGITVSSATANALGVIATKFNPAEISGFPTIQAGSKITVGDYSGEFKSLSERLQIPRNIYVANLTGNRLVGGLEMEISQDRTVIRLVLGRVERNTTFDLNIDGIKIAEVTSNARGTIEYRFDSKTGATLLAEIPTLTSDSKVSIGTLTTGKIIKLNR
ncbi:MAG: dockerin type I domain-containing protein [Pirellulales bacterium]